MAFHRTGKVDLNRERKAQPLKALSNIPGPVVHGRGALASFIDAEALANLSNTCVFFHTHTKSELNKRVLQKLLQAAIDDDQAMVTKILSNAEPERLLYLLTTEPARAGIPEIESKYTWLRFKTKKIFEMTQLLKLPRMTALLLSYLDKLEEFKKTGEIKKSDQKEKDRPERIKQWVLPNPLSEVEQKTMQDYYIEKYFLPLIVTLAADNTIQVPWERNNETKLYEGRVLNPSPETTLAFDGFRKMLLPDRVIDLDKLDTPKSLGHPDNYVDIEQFLIAACRAYDEHFDTFQNWHRRYAYSICIIGFIIALFAPDDGKKFCEGLYFIINNIRPVGARAARLQLEDGRPFYRDSRNSHSGAGFNFLCDVYAGVVRAGRGRGCGGPYWKTMSSKSSRVWRTYATSASPGGAYCPSPAITVRDFLIVWQINKLAA